MITFHSRQPDCDRHARKNENAVTFNFTPQIASSICTVVFTKCEMSDATIFKSRCSRLSLICILIHGQALPLSFVRFFRLAISSPMIRRSPARRSRSVREPSGKTSGKMPRQFPHGNLQDNSQQSRNVHAGVRAIDDATSRKTTRQSFVITFLTMTPKNYEHITDNTRSGIAAQSNSGIPARSESRSLQQFETVP